MVSDGGGAVIIASKDVVQDTKHKPVWIIGTGEATKYRENGGDITVSAAAQSGPPAFEQAGVKPDEIDIAMIYDSFSITGATIIEDLGFCEKGDIKNFVQGNRLRFDTKGGLALNTDGGGLCNNHPGNRGGLTKVLEAVRQLRGEAHPAVQVKNCNLAVAHGTGGSLGLRHGSATVSLERE